MDGVEVVKAVHHLRPDIDIAVITGYGTIETAVETMQHGANDYVQKPFTEEELLAFSKRLLIKREDRLEAERRPSVRLVAPAMADATGPHEFCVPGGAFLSPGHSWARIEPGGQVRVGLDDFARKALGAVEKVELVVPPGESVKRGDALFVVSRGGRSVRFLSPVTGRVSRLNDTVFDEPAILAASPYDRGWICLVAPTNLQPELTMLRIGKPAIDWYQDEIARLRRARGGSAASGGTSPGGAANADSGRIEDWGLVEREFLAPSASVAA
jgi:glycine cleavage system H lipoate-binding protein